MHEMGDTPKVPKGRGRSSLSLNRRLKKRISSPQDSEHVLDNPTDIQSSPRVSLNTDSTECTPPHKKLNFDDSLDDSPLSFDDCHSPMPFLSQTLGSESPEVFWRWTEDEILGKRGKISTDSGFSSNNSNSAMDKISRQARSEADRQAYFKKREERRRAKEAKIRKAERERVEALLRERIAKLDSQFKGVHASIPQPEEEKTMSKKAETSIRTDVFDDIDAVFDESYIDFDNSELKPQSNIDFENPTQKMIPTCVKNNDPSKSLDDFFNDCDTDCFLVEATQQLESELSQTLPKSPTKNINANETKNEKRSSLYMQFLEDDEDDFFVSLDDDWLKKATQNSKPRSPFQRYKSMPTSTSTSSSSSSVAANDRRSKNGCSTWNNDASTSHAVKTIKRHASSHAMSPTNVNYRGRQLPSRD